MTTIRSRLLLIGAVSTIAALTVASASAQYPETRTLEEYARDAELHRQRLPRDTPFVAEDGSIIMGVRCATHDLTDAEHAAAHARVARMTDPAAAIAVAPLVDDAAAAAGKKNRINVYFHVIHNGVDGNVSKSDIKAQMKVLNKAFRKHGFKFKLRKITRTEKPSWFNKCASNGTIKRFTKKLAVDPTENLNIYSCNPGGGILGFATLPGGPTTGTNRDGIFLRYSTLPNGTAVPFHLGDTATHEVGHYLGLLHTFQGGCGGNGDFVDDTPAQASPSSGCPVGRDSCPSPGLDPINNFMDYSDDACMTKFTKGQRERMKSQVAAFRPDV
jgi:hypothetical protein